ncbi:TerB family tellurite resistance protein [Aureimonas sp. ME7]|uniref:tellurite resistance TerB family protein n=1 Tax=Aureimonas sp. ME7 TaxID=2744252 RepID=UPI0015F6742C|nr:TerB family tellurite resistance protein [Aureimonas sp. ME7]
MLDSLKDFFSTLTGASPHSSDEDDPRVAAAALLFHVAEADGRASEREEETLRRVLARQFSLDADTARRIERAGQEADAEAVDLYRFTSVLLRHLDEGERVRFVEFLWQVALVDGTVHELEDNVVWRISELLGVSGRDRMLAKREAALQTQGVDP